MFKRAAPPTLPNQAVVGGNPQPPYGVGPGGTQWIWDAIAAGQWGGTGTGSLTPTEAEVLSIPAVSASLALLAAYATQMPLEAVDDATSPPTVVNPTPSMLRGPLGDPRATGMTMADWVDSFLRDLALWGNYVAVLGDAGWDGWPRILYPVPVGWYEAVYEYGSWYWRIGGVPYDRAEVFHVAINRGTGELLGRGLLSSMRDTLAAAIAAEQWAARYFTTGTVPSVHVAHPNPDLTQAQADELKQKFLASSMGVRAPVITPLGTEITVLPSDAAAAQLVEARKWNAQQLAIALGVPTAMLGLEAPSMTYRNIAEVNQQFISTTMMRYLIPVEQQLSAQCLPRNLRARFNTNALLRPDVNQRMAQAIAGFQAGLLTNPEGRALIDLPAEPSLESQGATTPPEPSAEPGPNPAGVPVAPVAPPLFSLVSQVGGTTP
jgi:HK97 family phage portal protein